MTSSTPTPQAQIASSPDLQHEGFLPLNWAAGPLQSLDSSLEQRRSVIAVGGKRVVPWRLSSLTSPDREIFRIRDEIAAHETDSSATFYDILGIKPAASIDDITKAYRTKTRSLHPDKVKQKLKSDAKQKGGDATKLSKAALNKAVKEAGEAQARLSLIVNILKGPERDRYDHFLSNGFPLWKGTDYYYNRYRPGLGTVLTGVFLLCGGGVHYIILYMSWKRQTEFVHRYIKFARETAWGSAGIPAAEMPPTPTPAPVAEEEDGPPQPMNRKQRRMQEAEKKREEGRASGKKGRKAKSQPQSRDASEGPSGQRKRVVAENGKILVVDSLGDVYLEEEDKEGNVHEFLLDVSHSHAGKLIAVLTMQ